MIINYQENVENSWLKNDVLKETLNLVENVISKNNQNDTTFDFEIIYKNKKFNSLVNSLLVNDFKKYQTITEVFDFLHFLFVDKLKNVTKKEAFNIIKDLQEICSKSKEQLLDSVNILKLLREKINQLNDRGQILDFFSLYKKVVFDAISSRGDQERKIRLSLISVRYAIEINNGQISDEEMIKQKIIKLNEFFQDPLYNKLFEMVESIMKDISPYFLQNNDQLYESIIELIRNGFEEINFYQEIITVIRNNLEGSKNLSQKEQEEIFNKIINELNKDNTNNLFKSLDTTDIYKIFKNELENPNHNPFDHLEIADIFIKIMNKFYKEEYFFDFLTGKINFQNMIRTIMVVSIKAENNIFNQADILELFKLLIDRAKNKDEIIDLLTLDTKSDLPKFKVFEKNKEQENIDVTSKKIFASRIVQEFLKKLTPENPNADRLMTIKDDIRNDILSLLDFRYKYSEIKDQIIGKLSICRDSGYFIDILLMFLKDYSSKSDLRKFILYSPEYRNLILNTLVEELKDIRIYDINKTKRALSDQIEKRINYNGEDTRPLFDKNSDVENTIDSIQKVRIKKLKREGHDLENIKGNTVQEYLDEINDFMRFSIADSRKAQELFNGLLDYLKENGVEFYKQFDRVNSKSISSIIRKLIEKQEKDDDFNLAKMTDLHRCRIIVNDLKEITKVIRLIDEYFEKIMAERDNKYISNDEKIAYRAIHYLVKVSELAFLEIQVKTLKDFIIGEIDHYTVKEDIYRLSKEAKDSVTDLYWKIQSDLVEEYLNLKLGGGVK